MFIPLDIAVYVYFYKHLFANIFKEGLFIL